MPTERGARLVEAFRHELPTGHDHQALRVAAAATLRQRLPHTFGIWATLDPLTAMWTSCVLDGFQRNLPLERAIFDNEYRVTDALKLRDLVHGPTAGALSIATGGDPARSARYRDVFAPMGVSDELRLVFSVDGTPWGALVLLSTDHRFDRADISAVQALSRPFGVRLRDALLLSTARVAWRPGTVLCDEQGTVLDLSPEAAALLGCARPEDAPPAIAAAVTRFGVDETAESVTAAGASWLSLRCTRLGTRVLVIVDRIDPHRLADVLIGAAGLTARERDVLQTVLRGATARAASVRLRMSEHTVNDHLKRIFTKFGVGSRAELIAHLFTEHYAIPHETSAAPSARGHFLAPGTGAGAATARSVGAAAARATVAR